MKASLGKFLVHKINHGAQSNSPRACHFSQTPCFPPHGARRLYYLGLDSKRSRIYSSGVEEAHPSLCPPSSFDSPSNFDTRSATPPIPSLLTTRMPTSTHWTEGSSSVQLVPSIHILMPTEILEGNSSALVTMTHWTEGSSSVQLVPSIHVLIPTEITEGSSSALVTMAIFALKT